MRVIGFFKNVDLILQSCFKKMYKILMSLICIRKFDLFYRIWKTAVNLSEGSACDNFPKSILFVTNILRHE
jgi:hypothetical protein